MQRLDRTRRKKRTSCNPVVRNLKVFASQVHTRPSVPTLTNTVTLAAPPIGTSENATASTLDPSSCPSICASTVPCTRLTARSPPSAPPQIATVPAVLIASELMPFLRRNRPSAARSLCTALPVLGSHRIRHESSEQVTIFFPMSWR